MGRNPVPINPFQLIIFMFLSFVFSFLITTNSLTIKLIRRDHVDTELFPKNLSAIEKDRIFAVLASSRALGRANASSLERATKDTASSPKLKQLFNSIFVVPLAIGSQPYATHLIFDTGSSFTWVQCVGCNDCFEIKGEPFNPERSSSYTGLSPNDGRCKDPAYGSGNLCAFEEKYLTGQVVKGVTAEEHVRFSNDASSYQKIVLGCAKSATGFKLGKNKGPNNLIAGIFGMAVLGYKNSFMETSKENTKWKFSYCLPPWDATQFETSILFGDAVQPLPPSAQTTPLINQGHTGYKVKWEGVSVAGKRLVVLPEVLKKGLVPDTGSAPSLLAPGAYTRVKDAFIEEVAKLMDLKPLEKPVGPYDLCFPWPPTKTPRWLPSLTYHFKKAKMDVDFWNIFKKFDGEICMTIRKGDDDTPNILGAISMANYRFVYNISQHTVSFSPEKCGRN